MAELRSPDRRVRKTVRMSEIDDQAIQRKAAAAGVSFNEYVLAKALERGFEPPRRPGGPYPDEESLFDMTG